MNRQIRGSLMLFLTAFIWGTAFVAQKSGMDSISPIAFNGVRTLIGGVSLLPVIAIMNMRSKGRPDAASDALDGASDGASDGAAPVAKSLAAAVPEDPAKSATDPPT